MAIDARSWQVIAKEKSDAIYGSLPQSWRIDEIPSTERQRDVSGGHIHQFLSSTEIEITETDATDIVRKTSSGDWMAEDVARAFCHRASLAHQFVRRHETGNYEEMTR